MSASSDVRTACPSLGRGERDMNVHDVWMRRPADRDADLPSALGRELIDDRPGRMNLRPALDQSADVGLARCTPPDLSDHGTRDHRPLTRPAQRHDRRMPSMNGARRSRAMNAPASRTNPFFTRHGRSVRASCRRSRLVGGAHRLVQRAPSSRSSELAERIRTGRRRFASSSARDSR